MRISIFYDHLVAASHEEGVPIEQILEQAVQANITCVELSDYHMRSPDADRILEQLKSAGMQVCGFCAYLNLHTWDEAASGGVCEIGRSMVDLAAKAGAQYILAIPGELSADASDDERAAMLTRMKNGLRDTCRYAQEHGITVGLEDYDNRIVPCATSAQIMEFLRDVPELCCIFDTGNFLYMEEDVLSAFSVLAPYIRHVHCKDRSFDPGVGGYPTASVAGRAMYPVAVGAGELPMAQIIDALKRQGYDGTFVIEFFGSASHRADMLRSAQWLREQLG